MDSLIGSKSIIKMIYASISATALLVFNMHGGIDSDVLFYTQWSSLEIVETDRLMLSPNTPVAHSFKDLDPDNTLSYGEFNYYVRFIEKNLGE